MTVAILSFGLLLVVAAAALLLPAMRRRQRAAASRAEHTLGILRDKLAQVERDRAAGLIGEADARGAEAEIGRALIATAREAETQSGQKARGGRPGVALAAGTSLCVAIGIYALTGSFELAGRPPAASSPAAAAPTLLSDHEGARMSDAITSLRARLEKQPDDGDSWLLLARSYSAVGAHAKAADAYRRLLELAPLAIELRGDYAEALIRAEDGFVGPKAVATLEAVLAHVPDDPRARYYLALRDAQNGEALKAAQGWAEILRDAPPDAPYRPAVRQILEAVIADANLDRAALELPGDATADEPDAPAAPGPTAGDVAAASALPADQQLEMIRGMVERLERRLGNEPGDVEGWLRLARSKLVLGEPEAAAAALKQGLAANPGNAELEAAVEDLDLPATR